MKTCAYGNSDLFMCVAEPSRPNEKPSCLFECLEFFASKLALHGLEVAVDCFESSSESVLSPREVEDYNRAKCDLVMNLIELVGILVDYHRDDPSSVSVVIIVIVMDHMIITRIT